MAQVRVGNNVTVDVKGSKLLIEVDLDKRGGASKSGKNLIIASTGGNVSVPGHENVKLGLNCYTPAV